MRANPPRERRLSLTSLFSPGGGRGLFSPGGGERECQPIEAIPGVEAICVQLQRMDQAYRALLADIEEHAVSEVKAAGLLRRAAEALAQVAVAEGEGEGDWGLWSGLGSSMLEASSVRMSRYKTRATAAPSVSRQQDLWDHGGALWTPAFAQSTVIKDFVDGVLARALAARTQYRATLAEASQQVARLQHLQEALSRAPASNQEALHQAVVAQRIVLRAATHKLSIDRRNLVQRFGKVEHSKSAISKELASTLEVEQEFGVQSAEHTHAAFTAASERGVQKRFQLHRRESVKGEPPVLVPVWTHTVLPASGDSVHVCPAFQIHGVAAQASQEFGSVLSRRVAGGRVIGKAWGSGEGVESEMEGACIYEEPGVAVSEEGETGDNGQGDEGGGQIQEHERGEKEEERVGAAVAMPTICLCPISSQVMREPVRRKRKHERILPQCFGDRVSVARSLSSCRSSSDSSFPASAPPPPPTRSRPPCI